MVFGEESLLLKLRKWKKKIIKCNYAYSKKGYQFQLDSNWIIKTLTQLHLTLVYPDSTIPLGNGFKPYFPYPWKIPSVH